MYQKQRGTCIKGLFWPPLEQKNLKFLGQVWYLIVSIPDLCTFTYFHQFLPSVLLEEKPKCKIITFIFLLPVAMVTKMAKKIGLKKRNCFFRPNLRILETDFLRIRYQHKQTPKIPLNILCAVIIFIIC